MTGVDSKVALVIAGFSTLAAIAVMVWKALETGSPAYWTAIILPITVAVYAYQRSRREPESPMAIALLNVVAVANGSMGLIAMM